MNRNVLLRIATDPPARMWSGTGDLYLPADDIEPEDGARYLGGGELLEGFDDFAMLINGVADRVDITVSGTSAATTKLAIEEAPEVKGAQIDIGIIKFDELWQVTDIIWTARYRGDKLVTSRQEGSRTITLSMGSDDTGRSRSPNAYWTDADHRRRSPTDAIFSHVSGLNAGTSRTFGPR